jgi:2-haloacid dehalogenase
LISLVTFDCYGTLIDWESGVLDYLGGVLEHKGSPVDLETFYWRWYANEVSTLAPPYIPYREVLKNSLQATLREFDMPVEPGDGEDFGTAAESWEPFPDSVEVLGRLKERFPLAVISNTQHDIIRHAIQKLGDPFTYVVTAEDAEAYKPDPRPFEMTLEKAIARPHETVHVARSQKVDLPRSTPMGMETVWVNRSAERLHEGVPAPAHEIRDLKPLPGLLERLQS